MSVDSHCTCTLLLWFLIPKWIPYLLAAVDCWKGAPFDLQYIYHTLNVRSRGKQLVLSSQEPWSFPRRSQGKHQDWRENKTNWFPMGPDMKFFVIIIISRLSLKQQQKNNWSKSNQSTRCIYNTHLILKTTE